MVNDIPKTQSTLKKQWLW